MNLRRFFPALLVVLLLPTFALASPVRKGAVTVELVSAATSIQPGQPFTVALRMQHDPHWHSYWINAGTGYPTSLAWTLPEGFKAGEIQWPTPHVVKDSAGKITGNGYDGENFLFVEITPPATLAAGTAVTLTATAEWLMCQEVCMPGDATVALTLPVANERSPENATVARLINQARLDLPARAPANWKITAVRGEKTVELTLETGTALDPAGLHFFSTDGLIDYEQVQASQATATSLSVILPITAGAEAGTTRLVGVLRSETGWGSVAPSHGLSIDLEFNAPKPATAAATDSKPPLSANNAPPAAPGSLLGTLALAFVGGLILNLMPCVFPVLGIKILGFVNQSGNDRKKITAHGLVFALGVLVSFWTLAGMLLVLRAGGSQLGWGFQLQSPAFVFGMAVFMLIFALNLSGLFEIGLSATGVGGSLQMKEGYGGSFFTGALATLVATPCSAPFLAPALGAALSLSAFESILIFTAIAIGLALPYLLLSIFPQAIKLLPRPGAWMETFKQFMAFPLYATVGWLLWVLAGQTKDDDNALLLIAFGFVLVAMAAWAYGRFGQAHGKPSRQLAGRIFAATLLAGGLYTGWPKTAEAAATAGTYQVTWEKWSPEAITAAQAAGKFVYVDFTARWCATCQTNKAAVFHSDAVLAALAKNNVVLLRADWTNRDPKITAELARWNRSAVPFNLIYAPGKSEPAVLPELLTPATVLKYFAPAAK